MKALGRSHGAAKRWPNLFLLGVPKSGTRSLEHVLACNSSVYMCPVGTPHYFADLGIDKRWLSFFGAVTQQENYLRLFSHAKAEKYLCDASSNYLFFPESLHRILEVSPMAKGIVVLRDPVQRAYSHYLNDVLYGLEKRSFIEAVRQQIAEPEKQAWPSRYVQHGHYASGLRLARQLFGNNLHVLYFEELIAQPARMLDALFASLGLSSEGSEATFERRNSASAPRSDMAQRLMGSPVIHRLGRTLLPSPARSAVRRLLVSRKMPAPLDPGARELLIAAYRGEAEQIADLVGHAPPWAPELFAKAS